MYRSQISATRWNIALACISPRKNSRKTTAMMSFLSNEQNMFIEQSIGQCTYGAENLEQDFSRPKVLREPTKNFIIIITRYRLK